MKRLIMTLMAAAVLGLAGSWAQAPRVRSSAPPEKTAQRASAKQRPAARQNASAPTAAKIAAPRYMAFKTNLAYDAIAVLNMAFECQLTGRWTAELPVMWSLWDWKQDRGLRVVALQPGAKYWFTEPGSGHALGANLDLGWYNYRWDHRRYQDTGRPLMGISLNYAYTLQLGRGWAAEFALGVGYVNTRYNTYFNIDNGALINTRDRSYFGPTRLGISLVYNL